jgi:fructose-1,6-bisphosphatase/sedoheptulose 1,7-bisphosphatase-like protein
MLYIGRRSAVVSASERRWQTRVLKLILQLIRSKVRTFVRLGANNAIAVLAGGRAGGLLNAPDIYMDKIVVGPSSRGVVDIDAPVKDNLKNIARRLDVTSKI